MSVFVGPSNTGKSYLAVLIYALHQVLGSYSGNFAYRRYIDRLLIPGLPAIMPTQDIDLSTDDVTVLILGRLRKQYCTESRWFKTSSCRKQWQGWCVELYPCSCGMSEVLDSEIVRCFGVEGIENLIRYPNNTELVFYLTNPRYSTS